MLTPRLLWKLPTDVLPLLAVGVSVDCCVFKVHPEAVRRHAAARHGRRVAHQWLTSGARGALRLFRDLASDADVSLHGALPDRVADRLALVVDAVSPALRTGAIVTTVVRETEPSEPG